MAWLRFFGAQAYCAAEPVGGGVQMFEGLLRLLLEEEIVTGDRDMTEVVGRTVTDDPIGSGVLSRVQEMVFG